MVRATTARHVVNMTAMMREQPLYVERAEVERPPGLDDVGERRTLVIGALRRAPFAWPCRPIHPRAALRAASSRPRARASPI